LNDPVNLPWTTTFFPPQQLEARLYAAWAPEEHAECKDRRPLPERRLREGLFGGLRAGLGEKASSMIVKEQSYDL